MSEEQIKLQEDNENITKRERKGGRERVNKGGRENRRKKSFEERLRQERYKR